MMARRNWIILAVLAALVGAGVIFLAPGKTYVFRLSETQLQQKLSERTPFTKKYLAIFQVSLDQPRIDLIESSDRVSAGVDVILNIALGGTEVPLSGAVDVEGGVLYRSETGEFFLTDAKILDLRLHGVPDRYLERAHDAVAYALNEYYRTRPIYSLQGASASEVAARLVLRGVAVKDEQLVITLGLQK